MHDDAELLLQFSQGDSDAAFTELVSRHLNFVYATALRQVAGDAHLAEDVAQSVFVDLARKAREVSKCPVLAGWLHTSTHHAAAKAVRTEQRRRTREAIAQAMDLSNESANDAEWARIRPWLDEALRSLSEKDSDAVLLRFFQDCSFAAIGAKLGLKENAARMRIERALEKIRASLSRRGITSTTVAISALLSTEALVAAPLGLAGAISNAALISTAGGGAGTATLFQFMSTTKLGIGVAAAFAAVAIGLSGYGYRWAREQSAASVAAKRGLDSALQEVNALRARNRAAEGNRAALARKMADLPARQPGRSAAANVQAGPPGSSPASAGSSVRPTMAADPKLRSDLAAWFKGLASIQFGTFFASAGLTPEQQARMLDLLVLQRTLALGSVATSLRPESVSSDEITQEIQEFVTAANVGQQYLEYVRTEDLRPVATVLAATLASTATPLTSSQGEQLTQILAANSPPGQPPNPQDVNWEGVLDQAQEILSGPQLAALRSEAALVAADGIPGTSFHPAGMLVGPGENAPLYVFGPAVPGK